MRYTFVFLLLLFSLRPAAYSQSKNRLIFQSGFASNALFTSPGLVGGGSHEGKGALAFGILYSRTLSRSFALETGLEYSFNKIESTSAFHPGFERVTTENRIRLISLPVYGNYTFLEYFFVNGGLLLSMETEKADQQFRSIDSQSGFGLGLGAGGKYSFKKMIFTVNPFLQKHAIVTFK